MVTALREADRTTVAEAAKKHKVSEATIYAWRKHFGQMEAADVKRLKTLEQENGADIPRNTVAGSIVRVGQLVHWLFSDTVAGANASANLHSLLQTCQVNGIDGYRYLRALFAALPKAQTVDDYAALLLWRIDLAAA